MPLPTRQVCINPRLGCSNHAGKFQPAVLDAAAENAVSQWNDSGKVWEDWPAVDCSRPAMKFVYHSGWGNQLIALRHALLIAAVLNRTLLVPPPLKHTELLGGCHPQNQFRRKGTKTFQTYYSKRGSLSALQLFNIPELQRVANVVDWHSWEQTCVPSKIGKGAFSYSSDAVDYGAQLVELDCVNRKYSNSWSFLKGTRFDSDTGILHVAEPDPGESGMKAAADWRRTNAPRARYHLDEEFEHLYVSPAKMLDFGTLYPRQMFSEEVDALSEAQISGGLNYRPDLWKVACKLSRRITPYIANHVRGGDGPYARTHRLLNDEMEEVASVKEMLLPYMSQLESLGKNPTCSAAHRAQPLPGDDAQVLPTGAPAVRMLIISDLRQAAFMDSIARQDKFQAFSSEIGTEVSKHGWAWHVAFMKGVNVENAKAEMRSKPYFKNFPQNFEALLLDVMMGALADFGFVGNARSTLSRHIYQIRKHFTRDDLCKVHDDADGHSRACPSTDPSGMDIHEGVLEHEADNIAGSHHAPVEADGEDDHGGGEGDVDGNIVKNGGAAEAEADGHGGDEGDVDGDIVKNDEGAPSQEPDGPPTQMIPSAPYDGPTVLRCIDPVRCGPGQAPGSIEPGIPQIPGDPWDIGKVDCKRKTLRFVSHSGWGNQVDQLQYALVLGAILNRTVLIPPVLAHNAVAYGACRTRINSARKMRKYALRLFNVESALNMLDMPVLQRVAPVESWQRWYTSCKGAKRYDVTHDCKDGFEWRLPDDVVYNTTTGTLKVPAVPPKLHFVSSLNTSVVLFRDTLAYLRGREEELMDFSSSLLPPEIWSPEIKRIAYWQTSGAILYRKELWQVACRLSRQLAPYVATHVRGGDGRFKSENHLQALQDQLGHVENQVKWYTGNSTLEKQAVGCEGKDTGKWSVRMLIISDLSKSKFMQTIGRRENFVAYAGRLAKTVGAHGYGFHVSLTRSAEAEAAILKLKELPCMANKPKGFVEVLLDIMVAALADVGFAGRGGSTLSEHIAGIRQHYTRRDLCLAHDEADEHLHHCPSLSKTEMDVSDELSFRPPKVTMDGR